jgi:UDP-2,4-diacetamido-2,4,6-trideoxy-beta-L-altropyranose hydrolase
MTILIRADATLAVGTGHVMRCAALGKRLLAKGERVHFVSTAPPGRLQEWLMGNGFGLTIFEHFDAQNWQADLSDTRAVARQVGPVDLLIVDHCGIERGWEHGMRDQVRRIMVIDDLVTRHHDCDLLLDQNLRSDSKRYAHLLPQGAIQFLGPQYALLRPEFDTPGLLRARSGKISRLLVFFGGTDPGNQTIKVIDALRSLGRPAPATTFVLGPAYPDHALIHCSVKGLLNVVVLDATDSMAMLMAEADLAIGTCGVAAWERCMLGLPSLVVVTAENQREDAEILHRLGAVENLGDASDVSVEHWVNAISRAIEQPDRVSAMGQSAQCVMSERKEAVAELDRAIIGDLH